MIQNKLLFNKSQVYNLLEARFGNSMILTKILIYNLIYMIKNIAYYVKIF